MYTWIFKNIVYNKCCIFLNAHYVNLTGEFWWTDCQLQTASFFYRNKNLGGQFYKRESWMNQSSIVYGEINQDW